MTDLATELSNSIFLIKIRNNMIWFLGAIFITYYRGSQEERYSSDVRTMAYAYDGRREIKDDERHFQLAVEVVEMLNMEGSPNDLENGTIMKTRQPSRRRDHYRDSFELGNRLVMKKFGITARQFDKNLKGVSEHGTGSLEHVTVNYGKTPLDAARLLVVRTGKVAGDFFNVEEKYEMCISDTPWSASSTEVS